MRTIRVLLRTKSRRHDARLSVKVVTNCRVPDRKQPVQIHLGYLSLLFEGEIPQGQRAKLLKNLRRKWLLYFADDQIDVDWADAQRKLDVLRAAVSPRDDIDGRAPMRRPPACQELPPGSDRIGGRASA